MHYALNCISVHHEFLKKESFFRCNTQLTVHCKLSCKRLRLYVVLKQMSQIQSTKQHWDAIYTVYVIICDIDAISDPPDTTNCAPPSDPQALGQLHRTVMDPTLARPGNTLDSIHTSPTCYLSLISPRELTQSSPGQPAPDWSADRPARQRLPHPIERAGGC